MKKLLVKCWWNWHLFYNIILQKQSIMNVSFGQKFVDVFERVHDMRGSERELELFGENVCEHEEKEKIKFWIEKTIEKKVLSWYFLFHLLNYRNNQSQRKTKILQKCTLYSSWNSSLKIRQASFEFKIQKIVFFLIVNMTLKQSNLHKRFWAYLLNSSNAKNMRKINTQTVHSRLYELVDWKLSHLEP